MPVQLTLLRASFLVLVVASTRGGATRAAETKPNILFLMSDDHAAHAIGAYGGRLARLDPTPTIDRLAREGIHAGQELSGDSRGSAGAPGWPNATYYRYWMHMAHHDNPAHYGIRTREFKLIHFYGLPLDAAGAAKSPTDAYWELYDLRRDPREMQNVISEPAYAETVRSLRARLLKLQSQVGDSAPTVPVRD